MDAHRVDHLVTSLIGPTGRRRTLGGLLGGALAALGLALPDETWARSRACRPPCGECHACQRGRCTRKGGRKRCRKGTCRPQATGTACRGAGICRDGACVCPSGTVDCDGACADTASDRSHCGACGNRCLGGKICRGGACGCPSGTIDCDGVCANLDTDPRNCGTCGKRCQVNATCNAGACQCVGGVCATNDATCCPEGSSRGACRCTGAAILETCETAGNLDLCPPGTLPCAGPRCGACCPAGSTCDPSTGTCLQ